MGIAKYAEDVNERIYETLYTHADRPGYSPTLLSGHPGVRIQPVRAAKVHDVQMGQQRQRLRIEKGGN